MVHPQISLVKPAKKGIFVPQKLPKNIFFTRWCPQVEMGYNPMKTVGISPTKITGSLWGTIFKHGEQQLLMAAVFRNHAIIQHGDLVRHAHGGEAMTSTVVEPGKAKI